MSVTARSLGAVLAAVLGAEGLREDPAARAAAAVDGVTPRWVAAPASLEAAARVLALAHDEGLAVVPRGSGSAQELGRPPARVDLVLDTRRLDAVLEWNPDDLTASVQAGITGAALASHLAVARQWLPLDPPGWSGRTLGGVVATQASGPLRARYGAPRDALLGVRFVQADGVVTWGGAKVVKSVTGYDVPKLLAGSLGTLGLLAELTLRLQPVPETEATVLVVLGDLAAARDLVARIVDSSLQPSRVELLDRGALGACGLPPAAAGLAVSIATVAAAVRAQHATLVELARAVGGLVETMGPGFWRVHDRMLAHGAVRLRVTAAPAEVVPALAALAAALPGSPGRAIVGSATVGVVRAVVEGAEPAPVADGVERLREQFTGESGSVVIERGPRVLRERVDAWGPVAPGALALMRDVKSAFDPRGILNPGRFVGGL